MGSERMNIESSFKKPELLRLSGNKLREKIITTENINLGQGRIIKPTIENGIIASSLMINGDMRSIVSGSMNGIDHTNILNLGQNNMLPPENLGGGIITPPNIFGIPGGPFGPTFRNPGNNNIPTGAGFISRDVDMWPHYPKKDLRHYLLSPLSMIASPAYFTFRGWTVYEAFQYSPLTLPISLALFGAELHGGIHSWFFNLDILSEGKYYKAKKAHWPEANEMREVLSPRGARSIIEVASAGEDMMTVIATVQSVMEIEGNKKVIWNSQRTIGKGKTPEIFAAKSGLVSEINKEYQAVWDAIIRAVSYGGSVPVDTSGWTLNNQETIDRRELEGNWSALDVAHKREALKKIYEMLGKRFITRGGLWISAGTEVKGTPNELVMTEMIRKVFKGVLKDCGEISEVGLAREVDISQYGFYDENDPSNFQGYENNLDKLAQKVLSYIDASGTGDPIHSFDYLKGLIDEIEPAYFEKHVRRGGEEIKMGLEYEARARDLENWDEAALNSDFEHIANTYTNHQLDWWDRNAYDDMDHGGRKGNSMNSLIVHLNGKWEKVIKAGSEENDPNNLGYIVAQDTYSALMRLFLENFKNGQKLWDAVSGSFNDLKDNKVSRDDAVSLKTRLAKVLEDCKEVKAERFIIVTKFLKKLEDKGNITAETLGKTLEEEGLIDTNTRPSNRSLKYNAGILRYAQKTNNTDKKLQALRLFFDYNHDNLILTQNDKLMDKISRMAINDTVIPSGYKPVRSFDFSNGKFFVNIDAEVNIRPELLEQTIPFFINQQNYAIEKKSEFIPGIWQIPQFYVIDVEKTDKVQQAAMKDQRLFYQRIQPGKSVTFLSFAKDAFLKGANFGCGSGMFFDLALMRQISGLQYLDPKKIDKQEPGGWSHNFIGPETFRSDITKMNRPIVHFIPTDTPVEDMEFSFWASLYGKIQTLFQDLIQAKGEAPQNEKQLFGFQHPKWSATLGTFLHAIMPAYLRSIRPLKFMSRQAVRASNLPGVRTVVDKTAKAGGKIYDVSNKIKEKHANKLKQIDDLKEQHSLHSLLPEDNKLENKLYYGLRRSALEGQTALYKIAKAPFTMYGNLYDFARYTKQMTLETSMKTRPGMSPFTKRGREFARAGTWYGTGDAKRIFLGTPAGYISAVAATRFLGIDSSFITDVFTPMVSNIKPTLGLLLPNLSFGMWSYLHHLNRYGQKPSDVMFQKEAFMLSRAWPGYVDGARFSLRGPSGRPGKTTQKGAIGPQPLPVQYRRSADVMTAFNIAATLAGGYLTYDGYNSLGWDIYNAVGGGGMAAVTWWALYHSVMQIQGIRVGRGGPKVAPEDIEKNLYALKQVYDKRQGTQNRILGMYRDHKISKMEKKFGGVDASGLKFYRGEDIQGLQNTTINHEGEGK